MDDYRRTIRIKEGTITAGFPFNENVGKLKDNFNIAFRRLQALLRTLRSDDKKLQLYNSTIEDYIKEGIIEECTLQPAGVTSFYLPHRHVWTPGKTTELRIVFDASSHGRNELSLNDVVFEGHALTPLIHEILLLFRTYKHTMVADIQKAFLQIRLPENHRDATRFLWIKDLNMPAEGNNVKYYRFCRVPFGINASPAILNQSILKHIEEQDTPITKELSKSLYVDNVLLEGNNPQELIEKYIASKELFSSIGMNLRDYLSDSAEVNAQIKDLDRAKSCELKVLGIKWKADDDTLIMECADKEQIKVTKRSVLSQINGFCFDPLGLLTPLMIPAKIFLQDIHKQKLGWDTILPEEQIQRWKAIKEDIAGFKKAIPRTVLNKTPEAKYMLSVFVDSSKRAYACCLYTTTSTKNGTKNTSLFTAKAKVAPIKKKQTIPRLELLSIFLGLSVAETTMSKCGINFTEVNLFSDSTIALSWIASNKKLPPIVTTLVQKISFAAERIRETAKLNFFHVPTEENAADCATRGINKQDFAACSWWKGPTWLSYPDEEWPVRPISDVKDIDDDECEMLIQHTTEDLNISESDWPIDTKSNYPRLKRIVAYCLRFIRKASKNTRFKIADEDQVTSRLPNAAEVILAEKQIVLQEQRIYGTALVSKNKQFKTVFDSDGILRKCGRIQRAEVQSEIANPMTFGLEALNDVQDPDYRISPELSSQKEAKTALLETEKITKKFWSVWKHDYLLELRDRHHVFKNGRTTNRKPEVGDVVLLDEDSQLNRGHWPMAVITQLVPSKDGEIRSAILRTTSGREIQRPLNRIVPLEIRSTIENEDERQDPTPQKGGIVAKVRKALRKKPTTAPEPRKQPQRAAKKPVDYASSNSSTIKRSASQISKSVMITICLTALLLIDTASANVLSCSEHGVKVNTTSESQSQLCLNYKDCLKISTKKGINEIALPPKYRTTEHRVQWRTMIGATQYSDIIICPPRDICDMVKCIVCADLLRNPHCAPNTAIAITAICAYLMMLLIWLICCTGIRGKQLLCRTNQNDMPTENHAASANDRLSELLGRQSRSLPIQSKMITFVAIAICLITGVTSCQYTHTLTSRNTICTRINNALNCRYTIENRITLSEHRPQACFRIQHDNKTIGSMEIQLQHVLLQCNPVVLFYTRDAEIVTESAKRCHFSGSCSSNTCAHTSQRSYIPELHNTYEFPGYSRCTSSCGSIGCGCLLPLPGCLFSRSYGKPQMFHCPTWEESAIIKYTYTSVTGRRETNTATITAQTTHTQKDANLTLEFVTTPTIPLLSSVFLQAVNTTKAETALVDKDDVFALRCPTMESSQNLSLCHVEDTCKCYPTDDQANCICKNTNISDLTTSMDSRLPLSSSFLHLQEAHGRVLGVSHKSIVDVTISTTAEWNTASVVNNEDCDITASPIQGCYNCVTGARLTFSCHSPRPTMVEITCTQNTYAAFCNENTVQTVALLQSTVANYVDRCSLRCGTKSHVFNISGILAYHPHENGVLFTNASEEASYVNVYNYPDIGHIISVALSSWKMLVVATIAIIAALALTIFCVPKIIKLSLMCV
ncbi:unnamed protein product [Cylicocyclus nassatus]|uniref:DUF5641 domain-containing protein n=1 Tax=Cylicocyclus nassatus TaxID=53992 RepID=A0AA36DUV7_CYLNA|nr:unnamed protein product [Cylicocyclus nassatus]